MQLFMISFILSFQGEIGFASVSAAVTPCSKTAKPVAYDTCSGLARKYSQTLRSFLLMNPSIKCSPQALLAMPTVCVEHPAYPKCGLFYQVQAGDDCRRIVLQFSKVSSKYAGFGTEDLTNAHMASLNRGLNCKAPLTVGDTLCLLSATQAGKATRCVEYVDVKGDGKTDICIAYPKFSKAPGAVLFNQLNPNLHCPSVPAKGATVVICMRQVEYADAPNRCIKWSTFVGDGVKSACTALGITDADIARFLAMNPTSCYPVPNKKQVPICVESEQVLPTDSLASIDNPERDAVFGIILDRFTTLTLTPTQMQNLKDVKTAFFQYATSGLESVMRTAWGVLSKLLITLPDSAISMLTGEARVKAALEATFWHKKRAELCGNFQSSNFKGKPVAKCLCNFKQPVLKCGALLQTSYTQVVPTTAPKAPQSPPTGRKLAETFPSDILAGFTGPEGADFTGRHNSTRGSFHKAQTMPGSSNQKPAPWERDTSNYNRYVKLDAVFRYHPGSQRVVQVVNMNSSWTDEVEGEVGGWTASDPADAFGPQRRLHGPLDGIVDESKMAQEGAKLLQKLCDKGLAKVFKGIDDVLFKFKSFLAAGSPCVFDPIPPNVCSGIGGEEVCMTLSCSIPISGFIDIVIGAKLCTAVPAPAWIDCKRSCKSLQDAGQLGTPGYQLSCGEKCINFLNDAFITTHVGIYADLCIGKTIIDYIRPIVPDFIEDELLGKPSKPKLVCPVHAEIDYMFLLGQLYGELSVSLLIVKFTVYGKLQMHDSIFLEDGLCSCNAPSRHACTDFCRFGAGDAVVGGKVDLDLFFYSDTIFDEHTDPPPQKCTAAQCASKPNPIACPAGQKSVNGQCVSCAPGNVSPLGTSQDCWQCPPGTVPNSGKIDCLPCGQFGTPSNSFSANAGSSVCTLCPAGQESFPPPKASPTDCSASQCGAGTYLQPEPNPPRRCLDCKAGTYKAVFNGATSCMPCAPGTVSESGASSCARCVSGSYAGHPGMTQCSLCPPGTFSKNECETCQWTSGLLRCYCKDVLRTPGPAECTPCQPGYYAPDPIVWAGGEFPKEVPNLFCLQCPKGMFSETVGASSCKKCPSGSIAANPGTNVCTPCPAGTKANLVESATSCVPCPAGGFSPTGSSQCFPCPPGTKSDTSGSPSCTPLPGCPPGKYNENTKIVPVICLDCPVGQYQPTATTALVTSCLRCQPGSFTPLATANTQCTLCAAGTFASASQSAKCTACPAGSYASEPGTIVCTLCPANTFSTVTGATSGSVCAACPPGKTSQPGATACT